MSRALSWLFGVALLVGVVAATRHFAEARDFARLTEQAQPWWLLLALALQAGTYLAQGQLFRIVARAGHAPLALGTACRLSLAKLFVDQAVPSGGLSGTVVLANALTRRGMARPLVATTMVVTMVSHYAAYVVSLAVALVITTARREATAVTVPVSVLFSLFAIAISVAALALVGRSARAVPRRVARLRPIRVALDFVNDAEPRLARDPRLLARAVIAQMAIVVLDAATVWVLIRSLGAHGSMSGVFASFMLSSLLRTVGIMPGGLGTFEAASVVTLSAVGVPVAVALAATLLFRGLSFWLPMLPGLWFSHRELGGRPPTARAPTVAANAPLERLLAQLDTPRTAGLSTAEAERRLARDGPNTTTARPLRARIFDRARALANPLLLILLTAGIASATLGQTSDAVLIGAIVLLSVSINNWQVVRSERAVKRLQQQVASTATVRRDDRWVELPRVELVRGDLLRLTAGDLVPADARLLEARDLHVQQGALTGESLPVEKEAQRGPLGAVGPDATALVFQGTSVVSGSATVVVVATGRDTAFGDIVERLAARPEETEFERGARRFGMLILQTVTFLVLFILVVNVALGRDPLESLLFSVALAVGLTPEFLPMITTVTLAQGAIQMARQKVIVKHLAAIQNLGSIDVLCSDKTGTLTRGSMSLEGSLDPAGRPSDRALLLGALNARLETGIKSPLDAAILAHPVDGTAGYTKLDELPFDFERRRVSVVADGPEGTLLVAKGAPESVLEVCANVELDGAVRPLDDDSRARCLEVFRALSARGARSLAVAWARVPRRAAFTASDERELTMAGFLTFADQVLEGASESLAKLRRDGVEVKILTGDNELGTRHVCAQVGLGADHAAIVLGSELGKLDADAVEQVVEETQVFARVTPAQKHLIIRALRRRGHVVGFLGDRINDAPSLHGADVGISVAGAVDVAREASDLILLEPRLDVLHAGILAGRRAFGNVFKYLLMGTSSNFGNMFSMAGAALFLPFLPMLPTQILLNNLLYDVAQLTIPTDHVDEAYVARPQRWDISIIRRFMLFIGPISSLFDFCTFAALLGLFHFGRPAFHTGWFIESLATQVLVLFVIRTMGRPWKNRPSLALTATALAAVAVGLVLPWSPLAPLLGFVPLPPAYLGFMALIVVTYLVVVELLKRRLLRHIV